MSTYELSAKKNKNSQWLNSLENTASDRKLPFSQRLKKGAGSTGIKLLSGLTGGVVGAALGRWSIVGGIIATGTGEIIGSPEMASFGVGMMASNLIPSDSQVSGTEEKSSFQKAKERAKSYGKGIMQKFWLDKLVAKKPTSDSSTDATAEETVSGMGEVKVYNYSQNQPGEMDMRELEKYEEELRRSAESFSSESESVSGLSNDSSIELEEDKIY